MSQMKDELTKKIRDSYELQNNVLNAVPRPLISVRTSTYNHAPYIRHCIEGVLSQKTTYALEYIIGEDYSTDGTREIVFEYAKRYPNIIRVVTADYNVGMKANGTRCIERCRGKYMAICEGDDYWTDPYKLQKQVDFLEANPDYSMCFHNMAIQVVDKTSTYEHINVEDREYYAAELFRKWIVPTASIVVRAHAVPRFRDSRIINGDINLVLSAATKGRILGMSQCMSVYRIQSQGLTIKRDRENRVHLLEQYIHHYKCLYEQYPQITKKNRNLKLCDIYVNLCVAICISNPIKAMAYLVMAVMYSPTRFANRLRNLCNKVVNNSDN